LDNRQPDLLENLGTRNKVLLLAAALLLAWGMAYYYSVVLIGIRQRYSQQNGTAAGNWSDLYPLWIAGRELLFYRQNPYTEQVTAEIQRGFYGRTVDPTNPNDPNNLQAFAYPVSAIFVVSPLLLFSFPVARFLFTVVLLVGTALSVPAWISALRLPMRRFAALLASIAAVSSYASVDGLHWTQMTLFVATLLAFAFSALTRERYVTAGILLALASVKPQLTVMVLALVACWTLGAWRSRKPLAFSFAGVVAVLLVSSQLILPGWFGLWQQALRKYIGYNKGSLLAAMLGHPGSIAASAVAIFLCFVLFWRFRKEPAGLHAFNFAVVIALTLTDLTLPNAGGSYHYQIILVPASLWFVTEAGQLARDHPLPRILWWTAAGVLAGQWCLALCVSLKAVLTHSYFQSERQPLVFAPELLAFVFPMLLALFILSVAPRWRRLVDEESRWALSGKEKLSET
jgi:hypothetical protein